MFAKNYIISIRYGIFNIPQQSIYSLEKYLFLDITQA